MAKEKPVKGLSMDDKEMLLWLSTCQYYERFVKFLRVQQNNVAILEWFRMSSSDPNLSLKKAYYEGQYDFIKMFINLLDSVKKKSKKEEENE